MIVCSMYDFDQWDTSSLSYVNREAILILVAFLLMICAVAAVVIHVTKLPWRSQLRFLLIVSVVIFLVCFIVSIPWEWYRLYKKAVASKQAQMEKEIPKQCRPDHELQPLESLMLWIRNSFTFSDDRCIRYQETLLVDPIWEVSPVKAISATVATLIAQPFEHLAEAIGKSFRALFREVPIQWQPFVFIAVILIIISMFSLRGLQVKFNIAPAQNQAKNVGAAVDQPNDAAGQQPDRLNDAAGQQPDRLNDAAGQQPDRLNDAAGQQPDRLNDAARPIDVVFIIANSNFEMLTKEHELETKNIIQSAFDEIKSKQKIMVKS